MSLKAKIEAVIYAAEEPVTLAQLAFLFGGEVLEAVVVDAPSDGSLAGLDEPVAAQTDEPGLLEAGELDASAPAASDEKFVTDEKDEKKAARLRERAIRDGLRSLIAELMGEYADRGVEIREIAGGYRVATKPEYHDAVRAFVKSLKAPMKLSRPALETLAVIAYKQPVTAPEIGEIRGVDSGGVLGGLMSRKLITTAGRKQVIGRPILYKTTREFLLSFGLKDVSELPSMEEFEKMAAEIDVEDVGALEDVAHSEQLPFGDAEDLEMDAADGEEIEARAARPEAVEGKPGVAVDLAGAVEGAVVDGAPELIELDSHLAEETISDPDHEPELVTSNHPSTTVDGE